MTNRPRASLGRVLDDLGATLLELVHGDPDRPAEIGGIVIHDPLDEPVLPSHALVLGVGLHEPDRIADVLHDLGRQQAAGLVVRSPIAAGDVLAAAVAESGVALLALTRGASWDQLAVLLRSLLADGDVGEVETLAGMPSGDLFALANATAALLDAPVTIEDRSSRVLAFSGRQDEADTARVETVLGRQVPQRYFRLLTEYGIFRELYRTDRPVHVPPLPTNGETFTIPRVAVAVRAGDEILGSIWAAVRDPLTAERSQALCDAAKLVALHMLRIRAGADVERRLRADLVSTALEGAPAPVRPWTGWAWPASTSSYSLWESSPSTRTSPSSPSSRVNRSSARPGSPGSVSGWPMRSPCTWGLCTRGQQLRWSAMSLTD